MNVENLTRVAGFLVLTVVLFISLFHFKGATFSRDLLGLSLMVLLASLFPDLKEFNFWGLTGKKVDKELRELKEKTNLDSPATAPQEVEDDLTKLKKKSIQLMTIDRSNFLALVFEIERLLRLVAIGYKPDEVNDMTPLPKVVKVLKEIGYLTDNGVTQLNSLQEVRNLIVHGRVSIDEDSKLGDWTTLAYNLYKEIYDEINARNKK